MLHLGHRTPGRLKLAGLSGSSGPPTPASAGTPRAGDLGPWPGGFWKFPVRRPHRLWATSASALALHNTAVLPGAQKEPLCPSLYPFSLVLALGITERRLAPSSSYSSFRYIHRWDPSWASFSPDWAISVSSAILNSTCAPDPGQLSMQSNLVIWGDFWYPRLLHEIVEVP